MLATKLTASAVDLVFRNPDWFLERPPSFLAIGSNLLYLKPRFTQTFECLAWEWILAGKYHKHVWSYLHCCFSKPRILISSVLRTSSYLPLETSMESSWKVGSLAVLAFYGKQFLTISCNRKAFAFDFRDYYFAGANPRVRVSFLTLSFKVLAFTFYVIIAINAIFSEPLCSAHVAGFCYTDCGFWSWHRSCGVPRFQSSTKSFVPVPGN